MSPLGSPQNYKLMSKFKHWGLGDILQTPTVTCISCFQQKSLHIWDVLHLERGIFISGISWLSFRSYPVPTDNGGAYCFMKLIILFCNASLFYISINFWFKWWIHFYIFRSKNHPDKHFITIWWWLHCIYFFSSHGWSLMVKSPWGDIFMICG